MKPTNQLNSTLSHQECLVLSLIAKGKQSQAITDSLFISPHTVKNHKTNICRKLNLSGCMELYQYAVINATELQNGGGEFHIGRFPIFGFLVQNRKFSY
jgi:DNA-binding CsgD family transcriptional regulator